ncbi:hypothetical protein [Pseudoalteromonas luteoviolacea]|uniref:hypothetical protein n=1 Tax=Pseudoalteromonas luteoviolacea TaxID=43657 RepID=UPI001269CCCD|nr:hypothetical protein [Pseudoalteromonas luteoviolacea]
MMKRIVITIISFSLIALVILAVPSCNLWNKSLGVGKNLSRDQVHNILGMPNQEWAKASNMDIWITDFLLGGVRIDILYSGKNCNWDNRSISSNSCSVRGVYRTYYFIWGNSWFFSYKKHT